MVPASPGTVDVDPVIEVEVAGVLFDETTETAIVLLGGTGAGDRVLPIAIGPSEAQSIAIGLSDVQTPRPLTHDLLLRAVHAAQGRLRRVEVVAMRRDTFLGELEIESTAGVVRVDARPSDCIALAVRTGVPIGVNRDLFDRVSVAVVQQDGEELDVEQVDRIMTEFRTFLEDADPEDFRIEPGDEPGPEEGSEKT